MSNSTTKRLPQEKCGECTHYRALIYRDTGDDAYCGRCIKETDRMGRVRCAAKRACKEFIRRGEG